MRPGVFLVAGVLLLGGCRSAYDRQSARDRAVGVRLAPPCSTGSLRHEGTTVVSGTLAQVVVHNCPGRFSDFPGCAIALFVLGPEAERAVAFERHPFSLRPEETLVLAGAEPFHRFFLRSANRFDSLREAGGDYARLIQGLGRSMFSGSGELTERIRVRNDGRVTAFQNKWTGARLDRFTMDASEFNACFYGFEAVTGPGGRVRIGVVSESAQ